MRLSTSAPTEGLILLLFYFCAGFKIIVLLCIAIRIVVCTGEAAAKTLAQGPDMVIQELTKSIWKPNARCYYGWFFIGQGNGTLAEA